MSTARDGRADPVREEAAGDAGDLPGVIVGTAGHVDHGKTALVRALTGTDTDRWREEKERGLTIDIGFARLSLPCGLEAGVVDVPGHEDFIRNMLAGATGVDLLLLVVAADEGPMPQTVEHLSIARVLGIRRGVVALSKTDRVDGEWLELAAEATRDELRRVMGDVDWPLVRVSATEGTGLDRLREALDAVARSVPARPAGDAFRLPVDRAFTVHGTGTVVTGTVWSGRVRCGDTVRALPRGTEARVRTLEVHGERRERVGAGRRCALALVGVDPSEVPRGTTLVSGAPWAASERLGVRVRLLDHAPREVTRGQRVRLYLGTREVMARVVPERETIAPGEEAAALLRLERPLVARTRDPIVLRFYSPVVTLGGARVAELDPPAESWRERTERWDRLLDGEPADVLRAAVALAGGRGVRDAALPLVTGLPRAPIEAFRSSPPSGTLRIEDRWFAAEALAAARDAAEEALGRLHAERRRASAVSLEALRAATGHGFAPTLVARALTELEAAGRLIVEGGRARAPGHRPRLDEREREIRAAILAALEEGGLEPPDVGELPRRVGAEKGVVHDLLALLEDEGEVVALNSELYVTAERAREIPVRAQRFLRTRSAATPSDFREAFDTSRKYLIPILEYLDRLGVTRRTGEGRELVSTDG